MKLDVIKSMIAQIKKDIGITIIKGNTVGEKPPKPFASYNITSPFIKGKGRGSTTYYSDSELTYEKRTEEYIIVISFNIFADDNDIALDKSHQIHRWFSFFSEEFMRDNDLVVANIGNIQDRTVFIVDAYEYKFGFDIRLRATDEQIRILTETIETINLGGM